MFGIPLPPEGGEGNRYNNFRATVSINSTILSALRTVKLFLRKT